MSDPKTQVPKEAWTAQQVGKQFIELHEFASQDYVNNPPERLDFVYQETY